MGVELTWLREADKMFSPTDNLLPTSIILDLETFTTNLLFFNHTETFSIFSWSSLSASGFVRAQQYKFVSSTYRWHLQLSNIKGKAFI